MPRPRVQETNDGIVGEYEVSMYDQLQRYLRDKGWIQTKAVLKAGMDHGHALELGSGPGYLGLEWLKNTHGTRLTGLDISADMVALARRNAGEYGLEDRALYVASSGSSMPFEDATFDAVFTNGSLHEWAEPRATFDEIWRVLRPGGRYFISDLRRDMPVLLRSFMWLMARPKVMRQGLDSSIRAAYTPIELRELVKGTKIEGCRIESAAIGSILTGEK
jgi:ubiquinone/menaquinone biosynthesis C-methylase UbiE